MFNISSKPKRITQRLLTIAYIPTTFSRYALLCRVSSVFYKHFQPANLQVVHTLPAYGAFGNPCTLFSIPTHSHRYAALTSLSTDALQKLQFCFLDRQCWTMNPPSVCMTCPKSALGISGHTINSNIAGVWWTGALLETLPSPIVKHRSAELCWGGIRSHVVGL